MRQFNVTPTILYLLTLLGALAGALFFPMSISSETLSKNMLFYIGLLLLLTTFIINLLAYKAFKKHQTPYAPFSVPNLLIQNGIFTYSRNPVYLALVLSQISLGMITDILWLLIAAALLWVLLNIYIIKDEEKLLSKCFKENYLRYKKQTRRWI